MLGYQRQIANRGIERPDQESNPGPQRTLTPNSGEYCAHHVNIKPAHCAPTPPSTLRAISLKIGGLKAISTGYYMPAHCHVRGESS